MIKTRIKNYWEKKSVWSKLSDLFFVLLFIVMLFPQGRMIIGGAINQLKAKLTTPTMIKRDQIKNAGDIYWELIDIKGRKVDINDHKGKVLFVNLWATWCPPCVGEMPEIQALYDNYKNDDRIQFLLISNESINKISGFINRKSYSFPVFSSVSPAPQVFESNSIPTTFLLSKNGDIIIRETGAANWSGKKMTDLIDRLMEEK